MAKLIYVDADGKTLREETKGKGRPPRGAERMENGDFVVKPVNAEPRFTPNYITVDDNGNELKREAKGRGRPRPGYVKEVNGTFAGHWVGRPVVVATKSKTQETTTPVEA